MQTIKAAVTMDADEMARLARRRERKRGVARHKLVEADLVQLRSEAAAIDNRINNLTACHESEVAALRAELEQLAEQMVDGPSEKLLARRVAVQQQIVDQTKALEEAIADARKEVAAVDKLMAPLREQLRDLPIPFTLAHDDVANPELLVRLFVAKQRVKYAEARLEGAKKSLAAAEANVLTAGKPEYHVDHGPYFNKTPGPASKTAIHNAAHRQARWKGEVDAARSELTAALAESEAIHRQIIEE